MNSETRERFQALKRTGRLPSPQGLATAVARLASRDDVSTAELVRLVKSDPAMAGRLLKFANAAGGGSRRHLASLTQAVVFLGLHRIRHLALAFSLLDQFRTGHCPAFDYPAYWRQSLASALAGERLAANAQLPPEDAFTCGLLCGIGRLALATVFPDRFAVLLGQQLPPAEMRAAEEMEFGISHLGLSAELMDDWGLPPLFSAAVRFYECPDQAAFPPGSRAEALMHVLGLAHLIACLLVRPAEIEEVPGASLMPALHHAAAHVGLDAAELQSVLSDLASPWVEWCEELGLPSDVPDVARSFAPGADRVGEAFRLARMRVALVGEPDSLAAAPVALGLERLGLDVARMSGLPYLMPLPEIVLVEIPPAPRHDELIDAIRLWRQTVGHDQSLLLGLLPGDDASLITDFIAAGGDDFLPLPCRPELLAVRLRAAQQLVAMQHLVRAEREIMIQQADVWARASQRMLHEALTDPLTQLPNRRYGEDSLAQEWGLAKRSGTPLACIMLDIDHFKAINDHFGHELGDLVLRQVADILQVTCRKNDIVFRYGGEEFCVICPASRRHDAVALAGRILAAVRAFGFGTDGAIRLTVSAGVACRAGHETAAESGGLVMRADAALYQAKVGGRDRVAVST